MTSQCHNDCLAVLIVDDERLARDNLRLLLSAHPEVCIVGEARNADETERLIGQKHPDLVFLDIQMPGASGFDLLARLIDPPAIIFVTAYDQYAIRAFEVNALDYLLKPVEPERLAQSLRRVARPAIDPSPGLAPLTYEDKVFLNTGRQLALLHVSRIAAIQAEQNYSLVIGIDEERYFVRCTLGEWVRRLPPHAFVRLDRSLVINRNHIKRCAFDDRSAVLHMAGIGQPLRLGRAALRRIKKEVIPSS